MVLEVSDWTFIVAFFVITLLIGTVVAKRAGRSASEFFAAGRHMPWWLLGFSMVATTFSCDTPNLITDIVRKHGVSGNWLWWAFLLTGMLTVFVYAKLWRRSGVLTDVEFYEQRYSGRPAAFLRAFRALYLGVFFNVMIMASVCLAAIKIGSVILGYSPMETLLVAALVTTVFSVLGGLRGVLITDFLLFIVAMVGAVIAACYAVGHPSVGGLDALLAHPNLAGKLSLIPDLSASTDSGASLLVVVFIIPLTVQWWSVWYPGAEPGGGGYVAQRMLAAKDARHATGATLFFNAAHYALRPWPWILVALCSLVVFPDLQSLRDAVPSLPADKVGHDLAYPAMLRACLPHGLLGLVVASLIAAFMSTISTHLNWGSSYVVNDFYKRFIRPEASEKQLVQVARVSTVAMMLLAGTVALWLESARQAFMIILQIGAGTGLLFLLRWFWWRINPWSELTAMIVSLLVAVYFQFVHVWLLGCPAMPDHWALVIGVGITTAAWLLVTLLTPPSETKTLRAFYRLIQPGGPGWERVVAEAKADNDPIDAGQGGWTVPLGLLCMTVACVAVYGALFATGLFIYGQPVLASVLTVAAAAATWFLVKTWGRISER